MAGFAAATASIDTGDGRRSASLDPDWFIWGPFGGYLAALAMRAIAAHSTYAKPATFSCQYLNVGVAGEVTIEVDSRKRGRAAECLNATIRQGDRSLLQAQAWMLAGDLPGLAHEHAAAPSMPPPGQLTDWGARSDEARAPVWQHIHLRPPIEFRSLGEARGEPHWACWLRLAESLPTDDLALAAARVILWMDLAPWNAALNAHGWPTPFLAPTLDLTVQFQPHGAADATSEWMLVETSSPVAGGGLFGAHNRLWSAQGRLVAVATAQALCVANPRFADQQQAAQSRAADLSIRPA